MSSPCAECPWRTFNQGRRHAHGFYTRANLTRLWNGIRKGGAMSCHPTDPSHPDHGAKPDSAPRECVGAVALVMRELSILAGLADGDIGEQHLNRYLCVRRRGLTKLGIAYWLIQRYQLGGVPYVGGPRLPKADDSPDIALPGYLSEEPS